MHKENPADAEENMPNGHIVHEVQGPAQTTDQPDFILHGIDYLPEFEKRKERRRRRKSSVPRFLRIDTTLWSSSYLRFLNRINRSSLSPDVERPDGDDVDPVSDVDTGSRSDEERLESTDEDVPLQPVAVDTPDCFREIVSDEWTKYINYPFENLVLSGGGSKGYAYIGSLQVIFFVYLYNYRHRKGCIFIYTCTFEVSTVQHTCCYDLRP